jgi:hypothetical protein
MPTLLPDHRRYGLFASLGLMLFVAGLLANCTFVSEQKIEECPFYSDSEPGTVKGLTPAQDYAGEVLAYLLQVVVGQAGAPENRPAWRSAGLGVEIDLKKISRHLSDPEYRKSNLFVLDTDVLGLSEVLYYYNPRLNQFKGRYVFDSFYPSAELLAVRLLILEKLRKGESVPFSALLERESTLCADTPLPTATDLEALNLTLEEFQLLKDIFTSEPIFFYYYKHPFIVEALTRIGFYRNETLTAEVIKRASYKKYGHEVAFIPWRRKLNIAILPSLINQFDFGGLYSAPYIYGFKPSATFLERTAKLKTEILLRTAAFVRAELQNRGAENTADESFWDMLWEERFLPRIEVEIYDQRPFCIHPENERRASKNICPEADLTIVVLGQDVYRSIHFETDPRDLDDAGLLYMDIGDIRYHYADEKIDTIARFSADRLLSLTPDIHDLSKLPAMDAFPEYVAADSG